MTPSASSAAWPRSCAPKAPGLRARLPAELYRHGVLARLESLASAKDHDHRAEHRTSARALLAALPAGGAACREAMAKGRVAAVAAALPDRAAFEELVMLLRSGECTPYELLIHEVLLKLFPATDDPWPWAAVAAVPLDADSMSVLNTN